MAIKIDNLKPNNYKGYKYVDIHFDLESIKRDGGKYHSSNIVEGNDIEADYDISAIRNSIVNLLTTSPGQRPLTPNLGLSLMRYIGSPNTTITASLIGSEIKRGIELWEPRVKLLKVIVNSVPDEYLYQIALFIDPILLKEKAFLLTGNLSQESGFNFKIIK